MFVSYFTELPIPVGEVEKRLADLEDELGPWADVAYRDGEELRARVGPSHGNLAKEVNLQVGSVQVHRSGLVYPISWSATGAGVLFPSLSAYLTLSHVGPEQTRISLEGTYEPPLGSLGRMVDRVLLRKVADSTVKAWVDRLAAAISSYSVS
jgi:hypothetical protein